MLAAEKSAQQREIRDLRDVIRAEAVLRQPHAPDEHRGLEPGEQLGELAHPCAR